MSKTDKDRPLWVQNAEHGLIDHDHRSGECIVSDDQRDRWPAWRHHRGDKCKKNVMVDVTCTRKKVDGRKKNVLNYDGELPRYWRGDIEACWGWTCDCPYTETAYRVYDDGDWMHGYLCANRYYVSCRGHQVREYHPEIPCSCDDRPEPATCVPAWEVGRYYTWGGVPSAFVRTYFHKPERARERKLDDMRREYNAYGDLEDGDFENRQARNSVRWIYW